MDAYNNYAQPAAQPVQQPRKISINELTPNDIIRVRGKVSWSHISYLYEGDELKAETEKRNQHSKFKTELTPHTRLSLTNAEIIEENPIPGQPSLLAQYIRQRMWLSTQNPELGYHYDAISKRKTPPEVYVHANPNQTTVDQIYLTPKTQELAIGLDVTVVLRVYKPKNYGNNAIAFDSVIINEPPRFFQATGGGAESVLQRLGLTVNHGDAPKAPAQETAAPAPAPAPMPQTQTVQQPMPQQAPVMPQTNIAPPPPQPGFGGISYDPTQDPSRRY